MKTALIFLVIGSAVGAFAGLAVGYEEGESQGYRKGSEVRPEITRYFIDEGICEMPFMQKLREQKRDE